MTAPDPALVPLLIFVFAGLFSPGPDVAMLLAGSAGLIWI